MSKNPGVYIAIKSAANAFFYNEQVNGNNGVRSVIFHEAYM